MATEISKPAAKRDASKKLYIHPLPLQPLPVSLMTYIAGLLPSLAASAYLDSLPTGIYDELSGTVHVRGEEDMVLLWRRGFFGKGSLSRSEPTWLARELVRRGQSTKLTPEDYTIQRRQERRALKVQKAKERLAERLGQPVTSEALNDPALGSDASSSPQTLQLPDDEPVEQLEYLQLQPEEAFFLVFCLGSLRIVKDGRKAVLTKLQAWSLFLRSPFQPETDTTHLAPDNPFLTSYVVYHHFRSLGWVIRNGVKFCTDWVLYKGADGSGRGGAGPVGGHAEFAVLTLLHYEDAADATPEEADIQQERRDWRFINTVNRVCSGVKKTLLLVYVTVPCRARCSPEIMAKGPEECLQLFSVREIVMRRFVPARMRD